MHYAWYIFPQLAGVTLRATGNDPTAISGYYAINDLQQAVDYLRNADLRTHLMIFATEMARIAPQRSIGGILGIGDANKFRSSMTLFLIAAIILRDDTALTSFRNALLRFGAPRLYDNLDPVTLTILREQNSPLLAGVPRGVFSLIDQDEYPADGGGGGGGGDGVDGPTWGCPTCTFENPPRAARCAMCHSPRMDVPPPTYDEAMEMNDDGGGGGGGGSGGAVGGGGAAAGSLIDEIVAMGFSTREAAMALARAEPPGNIPAAVRLILDEREAAAAAAAVPDAADAARTSRRNSPGRLPTNIQGSSRGPRLPRNRSRKPAKKWPKVQTGQNRRGGRRRRTRRRRRKRYTKKRRRRRRKRKTRRRNK